MKKELVLAVKTSTVNIAQGFTPATDEEIHSQLAEQNMMFGSREWLEKDDSFLQIIPYGVIRKNNTYLAYRRTPKGGEAGLHGKVSIGIGGHVNLDDARSEEGVLHVAVTIRRGMEREFREEISGVFDVKCSVEGFIYDSSNEVGSVHLGLLVVCESQLEAEMGFNDEGMESLGWLTLEELLSGDYDLETWTALALQAFSVATSGE